ncbi:peptidase inhibitor family I36 protein [Streptomyces sp. NPDC006530]|uniref:peptidase inhibitor family I36 protein n=1 Tax=Streptomyces sp. NPDC006530 TaxID=3364750 RepID=UPI0036A0EC94
MSVPRKLLLTAVALAGTVALAQPSSAQSAPASSLGSSTGSAGPAAASWHAFASTGFSGLDTYFSGNPGECKYVGDNWNDRIRSARTEVAHRRVELWDNYNCTGGAIIIDGSGYNSIGGWVSAYRIVNE